MRIALLGDIAFFGRCSVAGNADINKYFEEVAQHLKNFDYVVGNLETPFSVKKKTNGPKSAYICADPENVELLKKMHVDAVTLANNHMYDYGEEGCNITKQLLKDAGINYFGVNGKDLKIEKDGCKLAFSGFCCYSSNPLNTVPYGQEGVNEFNVAMVKEIMRKNAEEGYINVLAVHAGIEHVNFPSRDTIITARKFANISPYIYYGHHPHVAQGIEEYDGSLIAYSLGNFCFDDVYSSVSKEPLVKISENNRSSFILEIEIENNIIKSYLTTPIYIGTDRIIIGQGATVIDLKNYTKAILDMNEGDYENMRNTLISEYINGRKSLRNLMWVLKRLRPRYIKLIINAKKNAERYIYCVKQYL